jgi:glycosyltransferase involved in cell wall biosynthesis
MAIKHYIFLLSHPIQYFSPLFVRLAEKGMDLEVWYCRGAAGKQVQDREFGKAIAWDIPLLEGYRSQFLPNKGFAPRGSKRFGSLFNPSVISRIFKAEKSVLVIHSWQYATDWLALFSGKLAGHRIALWTEANGSHEALHPGWKKFLKKIFFRFLFLFVNEYWCIGSENRNFYLQHGVSLERLRSTPYSVDNRRFRRVAESTCKADARKKLGLSEKAFIILFAGKYIAKKRPVDLLEAFASLHSDEVYLVMVGEGELRNEMEQFISDHAIASKVLLAGFVNQSVIPLYYRAADLFVMCSGAGETWGLSVNEAMNFGLPILLSDLTGSSSNLVQEGKNGYVFSTGNTGELATRLNEMISKSQEERVAMGQRSLEIVEGYCFEAIWKGIQ